MRTQRWQTGIRSARARVGLAVLVLLLAPRPAAAVIEWVLIGDPGNPSDPQPQGSFGAVDYAYSISKFEVTNADYASFLNAKETAGTLGLYSTSMETDPHGGILRIGDPGSYSYVVKAGAENDAVNFVSFFDALRFANWLHNGEGNGSTETGAYTLLGGTVTPSNGETVVRNPGAIVAVPSQDEWFKAAYYDPPLGIYYDYPTGSDDPPDCASPTATPETANCNSAGVTPVGAYTGSPSPYGTFDQGGNVAEWNEDIVSAGGGRAVRGGSWDGLTTPLKASSLPSFNPIGAADDRGFRLVLLEAPEPSAARLGPAALATLGLLAARRGPAPSARG